VFRYAFLFFVLIGSSLTVKAESSRDWWADDALLAALPLAALGMAFANEDGEGGIQLAKSIGLNTLVVATLKETVDKERPNGICCDAFPSGHTSTAFVSAAFMHHRYGFRVAIPAYVVATWVGYARVEDDKHFSEDVVAGAAIGFLSSRFLTTRYRNAQIVPVVRTGYYGLQFNGSF
jgi:membrane-associated phospholipid phosphatase